MIEGLDVSHWQNPDKFDWEELKERGVKFMVARASYGKSTADRQFVKFAEKIREHGLTFGAYLFYRQIHTVEEQMALFDRQLELIGGLKPGDMYPVLDMEHNGANGDGRPKAKLFSDSCHRIAEQWRDEYGGVIIYYSSYFPEYLKPHHEWIDDNFSWLADYDREPGSPRTPYTDTWHIHQPKPRKIPEYANGGAVVDYDVIASQDYFLDLLIDGIPEDSLSDNAMSGEIDTDERPGGALPEEIEEAGVDKIRKGIACILEGLDMVVGDE